MATGSRGYHVIVLLQRREPFDAVRAFAREVARAAAERAPDRLTVEQRKAKRGDRIYVDVQRNAYAQTAVAPYAVRPRPGAPVATPLAWEELDDPGVRPDAWTLHTLPDRLKRGGDPWAGARSQALGAARRRLDALVG
jgi:bifunctional non-homologous end joining protein LigD